MIGSHSPQETAQRIHECVASGLERLPSNLRDWAMPHIISPRVVVLFINLTSLETEEFWLITDATGTNDSSYRVIYTEDLDSFGLSVILEGGRDCCLGFCGDFDKAIQSM